jgi:hypothetical protein
MRSEHDGAGDRYPEQPPNPRRKADGLLVVRTLRRRPERASFDSASNQNGAPNETAKAVMPHPRTLSAQLNAGGSRRTAN